VAPFVTVLLDNASNTPNSLAVDFVDRYPAVKVRGKKVAELPIL